MIDVSKPNSQSLSQGAKLLDQGPCYLAWFQMAIRNSLALKCATRFPLELNLQQIYLADSFTSSSEYFVTFCHGTYPLSDSRPYLAFEGDYHPFRPGISYWYHNYTESGDGRQNLQMCLTLATKSPSQRLKANLLLKPIAPNARRLRHIGLWYWTMLQFPLQKEVLIFFFLLLSCMLNFRVSCLR